MGPLPSTSLILAQQAECVVAVGEQDIDSAVQTYHYLSERWFTHASPTLFNAGTPRPQLSSCFLLAMKNDSIEVGHQNMSALQAMSNIILLLPQWQALFWNLQGIYDTLKECAAISKSAGGIGLSIHNIRAVGSYIRGTNGTSNGIVPMLRVFNDTARRVPYHGSFGKTFKSASSDHTCMVTCHHMR